MTSAEGCSILIKKETTSTLSPLQMEGGSNFLAHAGSNVTSLYCWHQAVGLPLSLICVFRMHFNPLSYASANLFLRSGSMKTYWILRSSISFNNHMIPLYTSSLKVIHRL